MENGCVVPALGHSAVPSAFFGSANRLCQAGAALDEADGSVRSQVPPPDAAPLRPQRDHGLSMLPRCVRGKTSLPRTVTQDVTWLLNRRFASPVAVAACLRLVLAHIQVEQKRVPQVSWKLVCFFNRKNRFRGRRSTWDMAVGLRRPLLSRQVGRCSES